MEQETVLEREPGKSGVEQELPDQNDNDLAAEKDGLTEEEPGQEEETAEAEWMQEKEELLDRLKRKQAEMDNLRRISKMEQAEAKDYALHDFLSRLLPVVDNLERALESARSDQKVPDTHVDGLEMIYKQIFQILEQEGVSVIEAEGNSFDPHCHHAVMAVESDETEPGNVVEELQRGYRHRERVLRPAMVKVCRE